MTAYAPALATTEAASIPVAGGRARQWIVGGALAIAATVTALVLLFRPWPARNSFLYSDLAPIRDALWTAVFVDVLAFSGVAISISLTVAMLVRSRGAALANVGAIVTIVAGTLFSIGAFAFAAFTWYVTDRGALPADAGSALLDYAVAHPEHAMLPQMLGFLLYTVGTLFLAAALLRSKALPRWLPILIIAGTAAQFIAEQRVLDFVQIGLMGVLVVLAAFLVRAEAPAG
jgi:hypothetical protein